MPVIVTPLHLILTAGTSDLPRTTTRCMRNDACCSRVELCCFTTDEVGRPTGTDRFSHAETKDGANRHTNTPRRQHLALSHRPTHDARAGHGKQSRASDIGVASAPVIVLQKDTLTASRCSAPAHQTHRAGTSSTPPAACPASYAVYVACTGSPESRFVYVRARDIL